MKLSKTKVSALALVVCLIATLSMGSLAWFTDEDSATNTFYFADSETSNPDDIFSVDVWEDKDGDGDEDDDIDGDDKGLIYDTILPGDEITKIVYIENTGHHEQYVRATVTVSCAKLWQELYGAYVVPLTQIVNGLDESKIHPMVSYYDAETDTFVYELYYTNSLTGVTKDDEGEEIPGGNIIVFESVNIPEALTREQAAALNGTFYIYVQAHAVQTENVGDNVYEAFQTVGLVKNVVVSDTDALKTALENEAITRVILDSDANWGERVTIKYAVSNKTIDFNGVDCKVAFGVEKTAVDVENVTVVGIRDSKSGKNAVQVLGDFVGSLTFQDCVLTNVGKTNTVMRVEGTGDFAIIGCDLTGGKAISTNYNSLTVEDSTFNGEAWIVE